MRCDRFAASSGILRCCKGERPPTLPKPYNEQLLRVRSKVPRSYADCRRSLEISLAASSGAPACRTTKFALDKVHVTRVLKRVVWRTSTFEGTSEILGRKERECG